MRILLSLLLLFGCGEGGDVESEGGGRQSIDCELGEEPWEEYVASIEGVHPADFHIVVCYVKQREAGDQYDNPEADRETCFSPTWMRYDYLDGLLELSCGHLGPEAEPEDKHDVEKLVVYYKRL
jgi:hypothetical protein